MISTRIFWGAVGALILLKTSLVGWWPFLALMNMPHDASLFISQAMSIVRGDWLGEYSEYTLMKGPMTPMWMALMYFIGVPYLFSLHVLYVAASILCLVGFARLTGHRGFQLAAFTLVLFSPYSFAYGPLASGFREGLHQPVELALVGLSIILYADFIRCRTVKWEFASLFGLFFFMFWNNREEGMWILPYLSLLVLIMAAVAWAQRRESYLRLDAVKLAQLVAVPLLVWWMGTTAIAWKNSLEYGVFAVVEVKTPEFGRAYGNMIAIQPENWKPDRTLQADVLDKIYSLPSGGTLDLNGRGKGLRKSLHNTNAVWLFRRAVRKAGYYDEGGAAVLAFYDQLGSEIESACAESRFDCGRPLLNALPPWQPGYTVLFWQAMWRALSTGLVNDYDLDIQDFHSAVLPKHLISIERLANAPVRVEAPSEPYLPSFFTRTIKVKTKYYGKLRKFYLVITPILSGLALLALISRVVLIVRTGTTRITDGLLVGLGMSAVVLLVLISLMIMTSITSSTRLYFLLYPVLYPLLAVAVLSLARDVKALQRGAWHVPSA